MTYAPVSNRASVLDSLCCVCDCIYAVGTTCAYCKGSLYLAYACLFHISCEVRWCLHAAWDFPYIIVICNLKPLKGDRFSEFQWVILMWSLMVSLAEVNWTWVEVGKKKSIVCCCSHLMRLSLKIWLKKWVKFGQKMTFFNMLIHCSFY